MADDIPFDRSFDVAYGRADRISPLVRRLVAQNPGPFTFKGTCSYIVGHGNVAVIDPGPADETHIETILRELETRGERVGQIVVTHTHRDHSPGARILKERTGAPIHAAGPHISPERRLPSGSPALDASGDTAFAPDIVVAHGGTIEGDGFMLEGIFTPGHMANHMAFALREENALFSGDHVMGWSTSVVAPPEGNMADYMASLALLVDREETIYWPGHGGPVGNPHRFVRAFITHRKMRESAILRRLEAGDRTTAEIVATIYEGLPPTLHAAAGLSVLAHLEDLINRGIVAVEGPLATTSVFRLA